MASNVSEVVMTTLKRFLRDRLDREHTIIDGLHFFTEVVEERDTFDWILSLMTDDESRRTLEWLIKFRIACYLSGSKNEAQRLFPALITRREHSHMKEAIKQLPEYLLEESYDFDLIENFVLDGYSLKGRCEVEPGDTVFDFGAHNGNSGIAFSRKSGHLGKIYGFEPNPIMREILTRNLERMHVSNLEIVPLGVSDRRTTVRFFSNHGPASRVGDGGDIEVYVTTIDDFVKSRGLDRVDFMKFDIEGQEVPAVTGARETIVEFRPKMAIAVYHLHWDIRKIVRFISETSPWYRFYLRHNAMNDAEVVLFCEPLRRL